MPRSVLRIGTRSHALALAQAESVRRAIQQVITRRNFELVPVVVRGDSLARDEFPPAGDVTLFTREIQTALAEVKIDLAVHDACEYPLDGEAPEQIVLASVPGRLDPRDAVLTRRGSGFMALPPGSRIGVSSRRRAAQMAGMGRGLVPVPMSDAFELMLRRLTAGDADALIVSVASLKRIAKDQRISEIFSIEDVLPAPGQGCLVVECRAGDKDMRAALASIEDAATRRVFDAERAFLAALGGDIHAPIACVAKLDGLLVKLRGLVASPDGSVVVRDVEVGDSPAAVGEALAARLLDAGAREILAAGDRVAAG